MSQFLGMDPAAVKRRARELRGKAKTVATMQREIDSVVSSIRGLWVGRNAQAFIARWESSQRVTMVDLSSKLEKLARELERQAGQQIVASSATGKGRGAGPGGRHKVKKPGRGGRGGDGGSGKGGPKGPKGSDSEGPDVLDGGKGKAKWELREQGWKGKRESGYIADETAEKEAAKNDDGSGKKKPEVDVSVDIISDEKSKSWKEGEKEFSIGGAEGVAEGSVGKLTGKYDVGLSKKDGLNLEAAIAASLVAGSVSLTKKLGGAELKGEASGSVGADAKANAKLKLGRKESRLEGSVSGFAGAKGELKGSAGNKFIKVGGGVSGSAGIGGEAKGGVRWKNGKFEFGGKLSGTLGLGAGASGNVSIDFQAIRKDPGGFAKSVVPVKKIGSIGKVVGKPGAKAGAAIRGWF